MNKHQKLRSAVLAVAALALGATVPAAAQDMDPRWLPWVGCWAPAGEGSDLELVCVQPSEQVGAMEILRVSEGTVVSREVLWADGRRHDTARESCEGWEQGGFSEDGRRLFTKGSYTCEGVTQEVAGVIAMDSPVSWLDVRVAGMGGQQVAWVQRYQIAPAADVEAAGFGDLAAATDQAWSVVTARMVAAGPMDVHDVIEASAALPAEAVQALLAEREDRLDLDADALVRMADAGVAADVIDVAVAVSYPDRFQLRNGQEQLAVSALDRGSLRRRYPVGMTPAYYDPFYMPWSLRYGYRYGYAYGGYGNWYGYDPYGYGWGYGGYRPTVVVVDQVDRDHGRVINGRGYSRGRTGAAGGGGSYEPARGTGGGRSAQPSSGSSGSAGSSSSGGSDTGRTAKRRGGGG